MNPPAAAPRPGECHAWLLPVRRRDSWRRLLDGDERRRAERMPVEGARNVFVTSRAAQRLIGSRYLGVPPEAVAITRDCGLCGATTHGRPRFPGAAIDYSVSHTTEWLLLAVTGTGLVGADIESAASVLDPDGLAGAALTAAERERFAAVAPAAGRAWFLRAWTRKEAAMKLTGLGLRAAPRRLDVGGPTAIADGIPRWPATPVHLRDLPVPPGHAAALASTVPLTAVRFHGLGDLDTEAGHGTPGPIRTDETRS